MLSKTLGAAVQGIDAITVTIEVSIEWGSGFTIVGLPDTAVKESGERTRCAIIEAGFDFPRKMWSSTCRRPTSRRRARPMTCPSP